MALSKIDVLLDLNPHSHPTSLVPKCVPLHREKAPVYLPSKLLVVEYDGTELSCMSIENYWVLGNTPWSWCYFKRPHLPERVGGKSDVRLFVDR